MFFQQISTCPNRCRVLDSVQRLRSPSVCFANLRRPHPLGRIDPAYCYTRTGMVEIQETFLYSACCVIKP